MVFKQDKKSRSVYLEDGTVTGSIANNNKSWGFLLTLTAKNSLISPCTSRERDVPTFLLKLWRYMYYMPIPNGRAV
jgi:hypothetical protein